MRGFQRKMKRYEESEKQQGEPTDTTVVLNGYVVPKWEYTDLDLGWDTVEESKKNNRVDFDIGVMISKPLEKQYEQLEEILLQRFTKESVDIIMGLVKRKKERYDLFPSERLILENTVVWIDFPSQQTVNILIYEKGAYVD